MQNDFYSSTQSHFASKKINLISGVPFDSYNSRGFRMLAI